MSWSIVSGQETQCRVFDSGSRFSISLYGGGHVSSAFNVTYGPLNSIAAEIEFKKSESWGFFVKGLYEITPTDVALLYNYQIPDNFVIVNSKDPRTFVFLFNFGARYYLTNEKISPYLQGGFSTEIAYTGDYQYSIYSTYGDILSTFKNKAYYDYYHLLDLGIGANIKLSQKLSIDLQYDIYPYIGKLSYFNGGYSALAGLKFNL
jgi:hypothetical protein